MAKKGRPEERASAIKALADEVATGLRSAFPDCACAASVEFDETIGCWLVLVDVVSSAFQGLSPTEAHLAIEVAVRSELRALYLALENDDYVSSYTGYVPGAPLSPDSPLNHI